MFTAYCYGMIASGMLYRLKRAFPQRDGYGEIVSAEQNFCGEALSSAIVLNRLGVRVLLEGNWIGESPSNVRIRDFLRSEGIDDSFIVTPSGYSGVDEIVFSDADSRTVFGRYEALLFTERQWEMPNPNRIAGVDIACVDPFFGDASLMALEIVLDRGIPYVAIDVPFDSPHVKGAAATIVSTEFLKREYAASDWTVLFDKYLQQGNGLCVFTFGAKELWYGRTERRMMNPQRVEKVVDTAGAGDSFRAGVMFGILNGMDDVQTLNCACAVAAEVVRTSPGVVGFDARRVSF